MVKVTCISCHTMFMGAREPRVNSEYYLNEGYMQQLARSNLAIAANDSQVAGGRGNLVRYLSSFVLAMLTMRIVDKICSV